MLDGMRGAEKGPYDEKALVRAVKTKMLSPMSLVRAEDETEALRILMLQAK